MKTLLIPCVALMALGACASSPEPRMASGPYEEGYHERALGANRYLIDYRMEGSDAARAYDLALWRAAQITLEQGYTSFEVVSRETDSEPRSAPAAAFATHREVVYSQSCGLLSCRTYATPTYHHDVIIGAGNRQGARTASLEVLLSNEPASGKPNRYDAAVVMRSLHAK